MTGFLLRVAAADRLSLSLSNEYHRFSSLNRKALIARASAAAARLRRRRSHKLPPVTPLQKRRAALHGGHSLASPVQRILQRRLDMASQQGLRQRSSTVDKAPMDPMLTISTDNVATTTTFATPPSTSDGPKHKASSSTESIVESPISMEGSEDAEAMPPPPRPISQEFSTPTRASRSTSTASRHANRLSLTLPIAPPTPEPSRPTPTSAAPRQSIPPTPIESSTPDTPSNPSEFIIAIAAQERRVLELREELSRAEKDLSSLKRQWKFQEATHRRNENRAAISTQLLTTANDGEKIPTKESLDMDRKKLLLQTQKQSTTTTTGRRGRVMRGGHTRTLSLLSPPKSDADFSAPIENKEIIGLPPPPLERRATDLNDPQLSKRISWQPQMMQNAAGMGFVEDFKSGLRAFVEDIRQITVGEEPIKGNGHTRSTSSLTTRGFPSMDQDTIRPGPSNARPKVSNAFDSPSSHAAEGSQARENARDPSKSAKQKHFSWTPLGLDAIGDNDWSNWESPTSVKSVRWSGSTVSNGGVEDIPEDREEGFTTPL